MIYLSFFKSEKAGIGLSALMVYSVALQLYENIMNTTVSR